MVKNHLTNSIKIVNTIFRLIDISYVVIDREIIGLMSWAVEP